MSNKLSIGTGRKIFSTHGGRETFVVRTRNTSVHVSHLKNGKESLAMVVKTTDVDQMPALALVKEALESYVRLAKMKRIWILSPSNDGAFEVSVGDSRNKKPVSDTVLVTSAEDLRNLSARVMKEDVRRNNVTSAATSKELNKLRKHFV